MSILKQAGTHPSLKPDSPSAFLLNFSNTYLSTFRNEQQLYKGCYINDVFPGCLDWSPALLHSGMWSSLWLIEVISWALQRLLAGPVILCMALQALWTWEDFLNSWLYSCQCSVDWQAQKKPPVMGKSLFSGWSVRGSTEMVPELISFIYSDKEHHLTQKLD